MNQFVSLANNQVKYFLLVVDVFSKYLWLRTLPNKKSPTVLKSIYSETNAGQPLLNIDALISNRSETLDEGKISKQIKKEVTDDLKRLDTLKTNVIIPQIMQSDNRGEFVAYNTQYFLMNAGIKQIFSMVYLLTSQRIVERSNRTIKSYSNKYMLITRSRTYIHILPSIVVNYNNTLHDTTGANPKSLHNTTNQEVISLAKAKIKNILIVC
jgi:transposase InsO family protein